jgi:glucose-6-phosphate dehydrogenase assembly protein OpcA
VNDLQVLGSGQPRAVDAQAIEEELSQLWQEVAEGSAQEGELPVAQVRLLNLVAFADGRAAAERVAAVMAELPTHHPCRSVVVEIDSEGPTRPLEARVTAYCRLAPEGGKQVCCEGIAITASGRTVEQLPGAVLPLLVPDLPYYLWWLGDPPFESETFEDLAEVADRIIYDSAEFRSPRNTLAWLAEADRGHYRGVAFADLNWTRLGPWRHLVAQFFDPPARRSALGRIESVTIEHAASEGGDANPSQALLMAAWLATRLGWTLASCRPDDGGLLIEMRGPQSTLSVGIRPAARQRSAAGEIVSLRLTAGGPEPATFSVIRTEDGACGETTVQQTGSQPQRRVARMEPLGDTRLVCEELDVPGADPLYQDALHLIGEIARRLESAGR